MVRSVTPMISAASHHFNFPAIAFRITSCIFIIRSISAAGICSSVRSTPPSFSHPALQADISLANWSGQLTCYRQSIVGPLNYGLSAGYNGRQNPERATYSGSSGEQKMNRVLRMTFAVLAMAAIALGADNTLGTWKYNTAKSKPAPGASAIKNLTLVREAAAGGVKQAAKGE